MCGAWARHRTCAYAAPLGLCSTTKQEIALASSVGARYERGEEPIRKVNYLVPSDTAARHVSLASFVYALGPLSRPSLDHRRSKVKLVWIELLTSNTLQLHEEKVADPREER